MQRAPRRRGWGPVVNQPSTAGVAADGVGTGVNLTDRQETTAGYCGLKTLRQATQADGVPFSWRPRVVSDGRSPYRRSVVLETAGAELTEQSGSVAVLRLLEALSESFLAYVSSWIVRFSDAVDEPWDCDDPLLVD